jgi:Tfp pilus assembly protein PilF
MTSKPVDSTQAVSPAEPQTAEDYAQLAYSFHAEGKLDEAFADFRQALAIDPNLIDAHYGQGVIYKEQAKNQEAIQAFQKVLTLTAANARQDNPARITILRNLTNSYISVLQQSSAPEG